MNYVQIAMADSARRDAARSSLDSACADLLAARKVLEQSEPEIAEQLLRAENWVLMARARLEGRL